jgi:nucleoside-diphosphate-sugar epimerase
MDQGKAIRTYCYISDAIEMFWNILFFGKDYTYNVGGVSECTILELSYIIGKIFNKNVNFPMDDESLNGSPKTVNISIKKYIDEFNKKDFISLNNGLLKTIEWQKNIYNK